MFLQMMRKGIFLLSVFLLLVSCGEYQDVLKSEDTGEKYAAAEKLYNEAQEENSKSKYRKALRLFEQIEPEFRGRPQGQRVSFLFADSYYQLNDHYLSGYQFERFVQSYPESDRVEEALFKSAKSYYHLSPRYDLDQTDTEKALNELQKYMNAYPEGQYVEEANDLATELRIKLEKKVYEIAKQYHHTENYKVAIKALDNFLLNYPGSPFREAAYYYRFDSAYELAVNSYENLMQSRLMEADKFYDAYISRYPDGEFKEEIEASKADIDNRLQQNFLIGE